MLQTGDILNVHHPIRFHWMRIAQALIRLITCSRYDHTAIVVVNDNGSVDVVEAQFDTGITKVPFDEWLTDQEFVITRRIGIRSSQISFLKDIILSQVGKKQYDKLALVQQLAYQIARRFVPIYWFGRTDNGKAEDRFYCSEFVSWCYNLDKWYLMTPGDVRHHVEFKDVKT